jgi:Flp pilus assembly pilin Flp
MIKLRTAIAQIKAATYGVMPEREEGQTNVEYALILVLVAIVAAAVLFLIGGSIKNVLTSVDTCLKQN